MKKSRIVVTLRFTRIFLLCTTVISLGSAIALSTNVAHAASATANEWKPGYIIDDSIFYNSNDMTASDIQAFLNSKVPVCDTYGTQQSEYGGGTRAAYSASRGYYPPFTCLKDFSMDVPAQAANSYCSAITPGTKSAATIIQEVSRACGIGSKVLLVILEKEQGLVSDTWPWSNQYRSATGYGCPDTAPCDAEYYGFFNQVYNAARQFKVYAANPGSYRYKPYQSNFIYWSPSLDSCGGSQVFIQNVATAGLYNYTPYQPNLAALGNLYGSGDGCSSYGNRNFWRMFTDWFGLPNATDKTIPFGNSSDTPITGDWDRNGTTDVGVWRAGVFYLRTPPKF